MNFKKLRFNHHPYKKFFSRIWDFLTSKTGAFLIGISAIAVGSYQFYINKPILKYEIDIDNVISSSNANDLKVTVKEKEYKDLYKTTLILNNDGALALSGTDVSKIGHDPIRVVVPKGASVVSALIDNTITSSAVDARLIPYEESYIIDFDYLNPDNRIGIIVLHEDEKPGFYITGSAVNVNSIAREWNEHEVRLFLISSITLLYIVFITLYVYHKRRARYF